MQTTLALKPTASTISVASTASPTTCRASLYGAKLEDIWNQYYANLNYTIPMGGDQSLNLDGNIYRTNDTGDAKAGEISNTTFSLAAAFSFLKAHTITLGLPEG